MNTTTTVASSAAMRLRARLTAAVDAGGLRLAGGRLLGVSGLPSSATTRGVDAIRAVLRIGRRASGLQSALRAREPFLAPCGQGLATLPQGEGLLERRRALLQLGDDPDEFVTGLLEREEATSAGPDSDTVMGSILVLRLISTRPRRGRVCPLSLPFGAGRERPLAHGHHDLRGPAGACARRRGR